MATEERLCMCTCWKPPLQGSPPAAETIALRLSEASPKVPAMNVLP